MGGWGRTRRWLVSSIATAVIALLVGFKREAAVLTGFVLGRTHPKLLQIVVTKPWLADRRPWCAEGAGGTFQEADFWSPMNTTIVNKTQEKLHYFFTYASPQLKSRPFLVAAALHLRFLKRWPLGGSKPHLNFIFVGPNILIESEILQWHGYNVAAGSAAHLTLVEPQEPIIGKLTQNAGHIKCARTSVINAAMCLTAGDSLRMWKFKDGVCKDPEKEFIPRMWSTLGGKEVLINTWRRNVKMDGWPVDEQREDDLEDWITSIPVKCHTASSLLQETRLKASDVDFLMIDAEGNDADILMQFSELPDFSPAVIIFEWAFHHASIGKLHMIPKVVNIFSRRGYGVYKDHDNLVIFRTDGE